MAMKRGFTLVELIVVVIILGILASVGIPQYRRALERSRGAEGYAGLASIQEAEKIYFATSEKYYPTVGTKFDNAADGIKLDITLPQAGWKFTISAPVTAGSPPTFLGTATRDGGPCDTKTMTIDQVGTLIDKGATGWRECVDGL